MDPVALLQKLIACPSVTPQEAGAFDVLGSVLQPAGFKLQPLVFSEPGSPPVHNLYARLGSGRPFLIFAGHIDVVPPGPLNNWRFDPFSGQIAEGALWGRGAVDMKGGVAAAVAASLRYLKRHGEPQGSPQGSPQGTPQGTLQGTPQGSIGFLLTGDEEGPAVNGTVKLLAWAHERGEFFDHCLLGEPTNPTMLGEMMKIGRRGSLSGNLLVRGKQGHAAYPHLADNPIPKMAKLILTLVTEPFDQGTENFEPSNMEITNIEIGNPTTNVIPAEARALFNIRFNDLWTDQTLQEAIVRRLKQSGIDFEVEFFPCNSTAFITKPGILSDLLAKAIVEETGVMPKLSTSGGTSDARFIAHYCPVVEFGLVGKTMHAIDEHVTLRDLETLTKIYERFLEHYFQQ